MYQPATPHLRYLLLVPTEALARRHIPTSARRKAREGHIVADVVDTKDVAVVADLGSVTQEVDIFELYARRRRRRRQIFAGFSIVVAFFAIGLGLGIYFPL